MAKQVILSAITCAMIFIFAGASFAEDLGSIGVMNISPIKHEEWSADFSKKYDIRSNHVFDKLNNIGKAQIDPMAYTRIIEELIKKFYRKLPVPVEYQRDYRYGAAIDRIENLFIIELDSQIVSEINPSDLNEVISRGIIEGKISVMNMTTGKVIDRIEVEIKEKDDSDFHMTSGFSKPIDKMKDTLLDELQGEIRDLHPDLFREKRFDPIKIGDEYMIKKKYSRAYNIFAAAAKNGIMREQSEQRLESLRQQFSGVNRRTIGVAFVGDRKIKPDMIGMAEITALSDQEIDSYKRAYTDQFSDITRKGFEETYWLVNGGVMLSILKSHLEKFYGVKPKLITGADDEVIFNAQSEYVDDLLLIEVNGLVHAKYALGAAETSLAGTIRAINTQTENTVFTVPIDFAGSFSERDGEFKAWKGRKEVSPPGIVHFARYQMLTQFQEAVVDLDYNLATEQDMDILFKAREYDQKDKKSRALTLLTRWWEDNGKNVREDMERLQIEVVGEKIIENQIDEAYNQLNNFAQRFPNSKYNEQVEEYQFYLSVAQSTGDLIQSTQGLTQAVSMWEKFTRRYPRSTLAASAGKKIQEYKRKLATSQLQ